MWYDGCTCRCASGHRVFCRSDGRVTDWRLRAASFMDCNDFSNTAVSQYESDLYFVSGYVDRHFFGACVNVLDCFP